MKTQKTKKSFKKKALLSSLSMLMVATVAVGSATFAWFTSSTTADTEGLAVHTSKASKLEISSANGTWGTHINYKSGDKLLLPTSSINGSNWYSANATAADNFAATKYNSISDLTNYVYKEQLNIKNSADSTGAAVEKVQIKMQWPANDSGKDGYLRVALVEAAAKGENKGFAAGAAFTDKIIASAAEKYFPVKADGTVGDKDADSITPVAGPSTMTAVVTVGELAPQAAKYYNLYVWFEGQDDDCCDANAGLTIPDIKFEVTGTPKATK